MDEVRREGSQLNEVSVPIRWRDIDAYGHVNNAVYLTYLEECRDACVNAVLGPVADTWDFVLVHVGIDYRNELKLEDRSVLVRCWIESIGTVHRAHPRGDPKAGRDARRGGGVRRGRPRDPGTLACAPAHRD